MKKHFPVPANCSKCGHAGNIYIEDESLFKAMEFYRRSRTNAIWAAMMVPRMIASWAILFTLGAAVGFYFGGR